MQKIKNIVDDENSHVSIRTFFGKVVYTTPGEPKTFREIVEEAVRAGVNLGKCNLLRANLRGACLAGARMRGAYLRGANLDEANLEGADLSCTKLEGANLRGAVLRNSVMHFAKLGGATLEAADLSGAQLKGADVTGADLSRTILGGKTVSSSNLSLRFYLRDGWTKAELDELCISKQVTCTHPEDRDPYLTLEAGGEFDVPRLLARTSRVVRAFDDYPHETDEDFIKRMAW